jgi:hypothetical protein
MLPPLKPIMMRERVSLIFIEYGQIDYNVPQNLDQPIS